MEMLCDESHWLEYPKLPSYIGNRMVAVLQDSKVRKVKSSGSYSAPANTVIGDSPEDLSAKVNRLWRMLAVEASENILAVDSRFHPDGAYEIALNALNQWGIPVTTVHLGSQLLMEMYNNGYWQDRFDPETSSENRKRGRMGTTVHGIQVLSDTNFAPECRYLEPNEMIAVGPPEMHGCYRVLRSGERDVDVSMIVFNGRSVARAVVD